MNDRHKIEEYLTAVRELEERIGQTEERGQSRPRGVTRPHGIPQEPANTSA